MRNPKIDTTPIYDKVVALRFRVYSSDSLGRRIDHWDNFRSRTAAEIHWRMLARKRVIAWLAGGRHDDQDWLSNAELIGQPEPPQMVERITLCERAYDRAAQDQSAVADLGMWAQLARSTWVSTAP